MKYGFYNFGPGVNKQLINMHSFFITNKILYRARLTLAFLDFACRKPQSKSSELLLWEAKTRRPKVLLELLSVRLLALRSLTRSKLNMWIFSFREVWSSVDTSSSDRRLSSANGIVVWAMRTALLNTDFLRLKKRSMLTFERNLVLNEKTRSNFANFYFYNVTALKRPEWPQNRA